MIVTTRINQLKKKGGISLGIRISKEEKIVEEDPKANHKSQATRIMKSQESIVKGTGDDAE